MNRKQILRGIEKLAFIGLIITCHGVMFTWVFFILKSWAVGTSQIQTSIIPPKISSRNPCGIPVNNEERTELLNSDYGPHPIARYGHFLTAGFWSIFIPLQFLSGLRRKFPVIHRVSGYVILVCDVLLMIGLVDILVSNLTYGDNPVLQTCFYSITAIWFVISGSIGWFLAWKKKFAEHRNWMIRHTASGNWVNLQRLFLGINIAMRAPNPNCTLAQSKFEFNLTIYLSWLILIPAVELYLYFDKRGKLDGNQEAQVEQ